MKSQKHTEKEYQEIIDRLVPELQRCYGIPPKALEIKHFSEQLKAMFHQRYNESLSYLEVYRIRRDIKLFHSIRKVQEYQWKINACIELSSNPLMDTFKKVADLLNDLRSK